MKLFADETRAPVLDPGRRKTKDRPGLWAYARDNRPWGDPEPPGVAYVYEPDRKARAARRASFRLWRHLAGRRLRRLQGAGRQGPGEARVLLGARAAKVLRHPGRDAVRRSPPRRARATAPSTQSSWPRNPRPERG